MNMDKKKEDEKSPDKNNFFKDEKFFIHGDFDDTISTEILPHLIKEIEDKKSKKNSSIEFYIDSNGGYVRKLKNLLGLFDMAKKEGIIIKTFVFGSAYSCGSILACAGSPGHRFIGSDAEHLCHLGETSNISAHNEKEAKRIKAKMDIHFKFIKSCYLKYAKVKDLDNVIHDNLYFICGNSIIKNGLADKII